MRACVCRYNGVMDEQLQDVCTPRYNIGGTVPIHGFLFPPGGDDKPWQSRQPA
jgi:hypothetical protein